VHIWQANTLQAALPLFIQRDMRLFMHREMIRKIPLLRKVTFFPMKDLCLQLRATVALTGDLVCERNTTASEMYFVDFGTLLVLPRMDARPGSTGLPGRVQRRVTVTDGGFFGSEMLCINSPNGPKPYEDTVEALSNCHLFYITSKVSFRRPTASPSPLPFVSRSHCPCSASFSEVIPFVARNPAPWPHCVTGVGKAM
jgi:hypothetical protein